MRRSKTADTVFDFFDKLIDEVAEHGVEVEVGNFDLTCTEYTRKVDVKRFVRSDVSNACTHFAVLARDFDKQIGLCGVAHIDAALDVEVQTLCHIVKGDGFLFESFGKSVITGNETGNQRSERADDAVDGMVAFGEKHVKTDAQVESKEGILFERRKVEASAAVDFGRTFGGFCFGEVLFDVNYGSAVGIDVLGTQT